MREDHMNKPTTKEIVRFFDKVRITKHCWLWTGRIKFGYGEFFYQYRMVRAHRLSYELFVGPIELGKHILHRRECGRRDCINPHHLYMGTNADNNRDRVLWGNFIFGEAHKNAKLTEKDVLSIRSLRKNRGYTYKILANMFGVGITLIHGIVKGQKWKQLLESGVEET